MVPSDIIVFLFRSLGSVLGQAFKIVTAVLPNHWNAIQGREGFNIFCYSRGEENISIQREVVAKFSGDFKVFVHRKEISSDFLNDILKDFKGERIPLTSQSHRLFVDRVLRVVLAVRSFEICAGVEDEKFAVLWSLDKCGYVDMNPYDETRHVKSFRTISVSCWFPFIIGDAVNVTRPSISLGLSLRSTMGKMYTQTLGMIALMIARRISN